MSGPDVPLTIVGGGIAGTAAAIALGRRGLAPLLLVGEAREETQGGDPLVVLTGTAIAAAGTLGIQEAVRSASHHLPSRLGGSGEGAWLLPRSRLVAAMRDAATAMLDPGPPCTSVRQGRDHIELVLADGSRLTTSLLLGCDGAASMVRSSVFGTRRSPKDPRYEFWQGLLQEPDGQRVATGRWDGPGGSVKVEDAGDGRRVWTAVRRWPRRTDGSIVSGHDDARKLASETFAEFPDAVHELIWLTPESALARTVVCRRRPLGKWGTERLSLLGAAAYQVSPLTGMGTTLALEDGVVAAASIDLVGSCAAGLRTYESRRFERVLSLRRSGLALEVARLATHRRPGSTGRWRQLVESTAVRRMLVTSARPALDTA